MVPGVRVLIRPRFLVAAAVAGVAAGLIGIAMALLLGLFESLFYGVSHGGLLERLAAAPPWRRALAPALGGLVAGGLWWWLRATGGVADVESTVADRSGQAAPRMGLARPFLDAVTQVLTVGAGNSVGREGAPRLAAGAVAARLATRLGIARNEGAILIASAAGAGLAAMYNAPLGGAAYAVELVMVAGMRRRSWMLAHRVRVLKWLPVAIGTAGLVTGLASLWVPAIVGNGRDAMEMALVTGLPGASNRAAGAGLVLLVGIVALKPVLTGLTLAAGATGGRLAPSLAAGSSAGAALAIALHACGVQASVAVLALAGAGAVLSTTQRAPVFGIVFTWELARAGAWTLVALFAVVVAVTLLASPAWRRTVASQLRTLRSR